MGFWRGLLCKRRRYRYNYGLGIWVDTTGMIWYRWLVYRLRPLWLRLALLRSLKRIAGQPIRLTDYPRIKTIQQR